MTTTYEDRSAWVFRAHRDPATVLELRWDHRDRVWLQGIGAQGGDVELNRCPVPHLPPPGDRDDAADIASVWLSCQP